MRLVLVTLLLLTVLAASPAPSRADQHPAQPAPTRVLPGALTPPGRVRQAIMERLRADPACGPALVQSLCDEGGPAAAYGLALLARHRDADVRRAALYGAGQLRLVCEALRVAAVGVLDAPQEPIDVRVAAVEALGWTGDGRDVPRLLESALDERPEVAAAAQAAFRTLTGVVAISRNAERRSAWWAAARASGLSELALALDGLEGDEGGQDSPTFRTLLKLRALHDIPGTCERLRAWLGSSDERLRLEGLHAAGSLRLADLAEDAASVVRFASAPDLRRAAEHALGLLGVPLDAVR